VSTDFARRNGLDQLLARVLHRGTWIGSSVIAAGLALPMVGRSEASSAMIGTWIITAGILLLIVLPVLRVLLMLIVFVRERDFRFGAIAMLVLAITLLGFVLGVAPSATGRGLESKSAVPACYQCRTRGPIRTPTKPGKRIPAVYQLTTNAAAVSLQ
jgi:Protein of unknown function (DUF1634)